MIKNYISDNLRYLIALEGSSMDEFGFKFELSRGMVSQYIRKIAVPKLEKIQRICSHFEITLDDFVNREMGAKVENKYNATDPPAFPGAINLKYVELLETTIEDKKKIIQLLEEKLITKEIPIIKETRDGLEIMNAIEQTNNKKLVK